MSNILPYDPPFKDQYRQQMWDAIRESLEIQGTILNDLELAINVAIQYNRQFQMLSAPDPQIGNYEYLVKKYQMIKEQKEELEHKKNLLEQGKIRELTQ